METHTVAKIQKLFQDSQESSGNVNLAVSIILLSKLLDKTVYVFGGIFRDLFRSVPSHDVDLVLSRKDYNFFYDQEKCQFVDSFYDTVLLHLFSFGQLSQIEEPKINNKYGSESTELDTETQEDCEILSTYDQSSTVFPFRVDHVKYSLNLALEGTSYQFVIDVSFVDNMDEFKGFSPACYQDSLYVKAKPTEGDFNDCVKFLKENVQTFCETKNVAEIITEIETGIIEICDISTFKRCQKISRLLTTDGYKLKPLPDEELEKIRNQMLDVFTKHQIELFDGINSRIQRRMITQKFAEEFKIHRYLFDNSSFKQIAFSTKKPEDKIGTTETSHWNDDDNDDYPHDDHSAHYDSDN